MEKNQAMFLTTNQHKYIYIQVLGVSIGIWRKSTKSIYIYVCCCFAVIIPCYILVNITATYEKEHEAPTSEMPPEAATENVMLSLGKF